MPIHGFKIINNRGSIQKMCKFLPDRGRTRVCDPRKKGQEGARVVRHNWKPAPQRFTRQKGPFMNGHYIEKVVPPEHQQSSGFLP